MFRFATSASQKVESPTHPKIRKSGTWFFDPIFWCRFWIEGSKKPVWSRRGAHESRYCWSENTLSAGMSRKNPYRCCAALVYIHIYIYIYRFLHLTSADATRIFVSVTASTIGCIPKLHKRTPTRCGLCTHHESAAYQSNMKIHLHADSSNINNNTG